MIKKLNVNKSTKKLFNTLQTSIFGTYAFVCIMALHNKATAAALNAQTFMGRILGLIAGIGKWAGYGFIAAAIVSFILASINDESQGKSRALLFATCGVVMILLKTILGNITGITITDVGI